MPEEKVVCQTPSPGKKPTRILRWKYETIRKAILKVIPKHGEGILFSDLLLMVDEKIKANGVKNLGSTPWYTTVVKLDMEVKDEIRRISGSNPQRLIQAG